MPSALTYPGVYIEELPSGVRTIIGVATSVAAFVGRTERGPVDTATTVTSPGDFERTFGSPDANAPVAHAVRDFFLNGGTQAVIVRVYKRPAAGNENAKLNSNGLSLIARDKGASGNAIRARVDHATRPAAVGEDATALFNLFVQDTATGATEEYRNVSVAPAHPQRIDRILESASSLVLLDGAVPAARPTAHADLPADLPKPRTVWDDPTGGTDTAVTSTKVATADVAVDSDPLDDSAYFAGANFQSEKKGLFALDGTDLFNMLCIPPDTITGDTTAKTYAAALTYCVNRRAFLIVDSRADWQNADGTLKPAFKNNPRKAKTDDLGLSGPAARNAAVYFPRVLQPDPAQDNRDALFAPCGIVAGLFAKTDATRGVWKAPAGVDAGVLGVRKLGVNLTDDENGLLNPVGINCLRNFRAAGNVVWGSRTLRGDDQTPDDYKYVPVRRLALFIEESLYRGTQWAVFEPNDEPLWAQLRVNIKAFMNDLFRQGAFAGSSPAQAYKVKCDSETTTPSDVNKGIVNVLVGFAPLKPAEFVVLKIQQLAGQLDS